MAGAQINTDFQSPTPTDEIYLNIFLKQSFHPTPNSLSLLSDIAKVPRHYANNGKQYVIVSLYDLERSCVDLQLE